jgi:hypothetical protein
MDLSRTSEICKVLTNSRHDITTVTGRARSYNHTRLETRLNTRRKNTGSTNAAHSCFAH